MSKSAVVLNVWYAELVKNVTLKILGKKES
jgi:hypothetical protein